MDQNRPPQHLSAAVTRLKEQLGSDEDGADAKHAKYVLDSRVDFGVHSYLAGLEALKNQGVTKQ